MKQILDQTTEELTIADNKHNKWLVGYESSPANPAKFNLQQFITLDADGIVSTTDKAPVKFSRIEINNNTNFNSTATFCNDNLSQSSSKVVLENNGQHFFASIVKDSIDKATQSLSIDLNTNEVNVSNSLNVAQNINTPTITLQRQNPFQKGGELTFARSIDNKNYWHFDCFGNNQTPSLRWHSDGSMKLQLEANGNLTASGDIAAFSDINFKTDIKQIENALEKVLELKGVEFKKIEDGSSHIGVIAQHVEKVLPEVVSEINGVKTVAYGNMVGLLIEAIKELTNEVRSLKQIS
jgi:hypothetical protein